MQTSTDSAEVIGVAIGSDAPLGSESHLVDPGRDVPFAGSTTGEIALLRGASGMHHLTLVALALG